MKYVSVRPLACFISEIAEWVFNKLVLDVYINGCRGKLTFLGTDHWKMYMDLQFNYGLYLKLTQK